MARGSAARAGGGNNGRGGCQATHKSRGEIGSRACGRPGRAGQGGTRRTAWLRGRDSGHPSTGLPGVTSTFKCLIPELRVQVLNRVGCIRV